MSQQANGKIPVLIASTLKPVKDVRAYGKLAQSLGETNKYRLFIIGFSPKKPKNDNEIRFFSSMSHFDSGIDRFLAQIRFAWKMIVIQPRLVICCTYEYLPLAGLFQRFGKLKIVYDVQENYLANLELNFSQYSWRKKLAAKLIRWAEKSASADLFVLAEKCYAVEMPDKRPYLILENKFQGKINYKGPVLFTDKKAFHFVITGTLTPTYGILDAMAWFKALLDKYPENTLHITGHVTIPDFSEKLKNEAEGIDQIRLQFSSEPIPNTLLLAEVKKADFVLLPYQLHPAIQSKMPTKLFECAALGVPVLMTPNPIWEQFFESYQGGVSVDFTDLEGSLTLFHHAIAQTYFSTPAPQSVLWDSQKTEFQQIIEKILA